MLPDRFWAKVEKTPTCWLWTGAKANGYGQLIAERCVQGGRARGPEPMGAFTVTRQEYLQRISAMAVRVWSSEDADELRRTIREIEGIARSAINESRSIEGPHPESAEWHAGYEAGREEAPPDSALLRQLLDYAGHDMNCAELHDEACDCGFLRVYERARAFLAAHGAGEET